MCIPCVLFDFPTDTNVCRKCSENCLKCTSYSICTECKPDTRWNKFSDDVWINCSVNIAPSLPAAENTDSPCAHNLQSIIRIRKNNSVFNIIFVFWKSYLCCSAHNSKSIYILSDIITVSQEKDKTSLTNSPYCWFISFWEYSVHWLSSPSACGGVLWVGKLSLQSNGSESSLRCHMIGCVCHGATCSLRPLQSAEESVPTELCGRILPWQAGRHMQALSQGLCYLCRWEWKSRVKDQQ